MAVAAVGLLGAFWFLALAPKRDRASKLDTQLTSAKQTLSQAQQEKVQFTQAQAQFPALYASLGRLGKAVPADEDVPSLLVQLNHAAAKANVDFRSVELKLDLADQISATTGAAATAGAAPATGATGAAGATGSTGAAGATATASAPATGTAPTGADSTGAATGTLEPLPFQYTFKGDFFKLENLIRNVTRLVNKRNRHLAISGRLVVIAGFALKRHEVTILAASFLLPADQGLFAGASPAGPAITTGATPQPAAASASPTAPPTAATTTP
jgi:hypothetical protein